MTIALTKVISILSLVCRSNANNADHVPHSPTNNCKSSKHRLPKINIPMFICAKNWPKKRNWRRHAFKCGSQIVGPEIANTLIPTNYRTVSPIYHCNFNRNFPSTRPHFQRCRTAPGRRCRCLRHFNGHRPASITIWPHNKAALIIWIHCNTIQTRTVIISMHPFYHRQTQTIQHRSAHHPAHRPVRIRWVQPAAAHQIASPMYHMPHQLSHRISCRPVSVRSIWIRRAHTITLHPFRADTKPIILIMHTQRWPIATTGSHPDLANGKATGIKSFS